jgi:3-phosphoglycerate kinase
MKNLKSFNFLNKRVLVRCDLNVPLDDKGDILDDHKIRLIWDTVKYLILQKANIILFGHLGEPNGVVVPKLKLDKIAKNLEKHLDFPIAIADDCIGPEIEFYVNAMKGDNILLLQNLKFYKAEIEGDTDFAEKLSWLCEVYINDDFTDCHKSYASIVGVPQYLTSAAGLLLEKEINNLDNFLNSSEKPVLVIVGGHENDIKLKFIDRMSKLVDWVMINSLVKEGLVKNGLLFKNQDKIICPVGFKDSLDIDESTIELFKEKISQAKTILWYGSFGKVEEKQYTKGTLAIAKAIINSKATSIIGGEKNIAFLTQQGLISKFSYVSYSGEAILQYLSGERLPGLIALK